MTADFSYIRQALEKNLATISGVPKIAWENVPFDPKDEDKWIRAKLIPTEQRPSAVGVGAKILHRGIFLVDCFVRQNDGQGGPLSADELAQKIQDAFSYGTVLTESGNQIRIRYSERSGAIDDSPWYFVPVSIEWYSFIT